MWISRMTGQEFGWYIEVLLIQMDELSLDKSTKLIMNDDIKGEKWFNKVVSRIKIKLFRLK